MLARASICLAMVAMLSCHHGDKQPSRSAPDRPESLDLPEVQTARARAPGATQVFITRRALQVDGSRIAAISHGVIEKSSRVGKRERGEPIPALEAALRQSGEPWVTKHGPVTTVYEGVPPVEVVADRNTPFHLLGAVMEAAMLDGYRRIGLVVRRKRGGEGALPIVLPHVAARGVVDRDAAPAVVKVQPVVSIGRRKTLVWSVSGEEGTLAHPAFTIAGDRPAAIAKAVAEIAQRRWPDKKPSQRECLMLQINDDAPVQEIASLLAAILPTFGNIALAPAFF